MRSLLQTLIVISSFAHPIAAFSGGRRVFVGTPVHQNRRLVSDCMTPLSNLCTLVESSTVDEAVHMLLDLNVSGAPVINAETGELLGIVSTYDFLQQEAGDGALLPIQGSIEDVKAYLEQAKKVRASFIYFEPIADTSNEFSFLLLIIRGLVDLCAKGGRSYDA